jgi:predicted  nucleic acid-binding Zn-ribbon protein
LNTEREELLGKIEAGDGAANTAMQQLKLQNEKLTKQVESVNSDKQEIIEQNKRKVEELHSLLNETKLGLASANEKLKTLDSEKNDLTSKHSVLLKEKTKLEQDLQDKTKLVAKTKAENEKQIRQIQAQLETAENSRKTSVAQCDELQKKQTNVLFVFDSSSFKTERTFVCFFCNSSH